MVDTDHVTRRTAIKRGAVALGAVTGLGMVNTAAADLDGSTVRIEGDGSYHLGIRGNFDEVETEDFEDNITHEEGYGIDLNGTVSDGYFGFFADEEDIVHLDDTISKYDVEVLGLGVDDGVEVYVDDEQRI